MRWISKILVGFILLGYGCSTSPIQKQEQDQAGIILSAEYNDPQILEWINKLASSKFFEYTQAARHLMALGTKAVPYLHAQLNRKREANDTVIPVCRVLLMIIIQQQDDAWVQSQQQSNLPAVRELAEQEWQKRVQKLKK